MVESDHSLRTRMHSLQFSAYWTRKRIPSARGKGLNNDRRNPNGTLLRRFRARGLPGSIAVVDVS